MPGKTTKKTLAGSKAGKKKGPAARKVGKSPSTKKPAAGKDPSKVAAGQARAEKHPERTPGSGRAKGTPNKRTVELREALVAAGMTDDLHPVVMMFKVYKGEMTMPVVIKGGKDEADEVVEMELPPDLRVKCMAEVAQYLEPKRKAVELTGEGGQPLKVVLLKLDELEPSGVGVEKD